MKKNKILHDYKKEKIWQITLAITKQNRKTLSNTDLTRYSNRFKWHIL